MPTARDGGGAKKKSTKRGAPAKAGTTRYAGGSTAGKVGTSGGYTTYTSRDGKSSTSINREGTYTSTGGTVGDINYKPHTKGNLNSKSRQASIAATRRMQSERSGGAAASYRKPSGKKQGRTR